MRQNTKKWAATALWLLFLLLLALLRWVDVAPVGAGDTPLGLSHLNLAVFQAVGVHPFWYRLTSLLGYAALGLAGLFALVGVVQLIRRRSIFRVDKPILALGFLYAVVLALYAFFEKVIVNYRPILLPGNDQPEASFPSSHTMLLCVILGSALLVMDRYVKGESLRRVPRVLGGLIIVLAVVGRQLSGVHWFTDILGSVILSGALLCSFSLLLDALGADTP